MNIKKKKMLEKVRERKNIKKKRNHAQKVEGQRMRIYYARGSTKRNAREIEQISWLHDAISIGGVYILFYFV